MGNRQSAMVGRRGDDQVPDYRHQPTAVVPLAFPFRLSGRLIAGLALSPPTLDDLIHLRAAPALDARALLAVLTGLPPVAIGALRWPDVEVVLETGLALLPPDLRARLEAPDTDAAAADPSIAGALAIEAEGSAADDQPRSDANPPPAPANVADAFGAADPAEFMREA